MDKKESSLQSALECNSELPTTNWKETKQIPSSQSISEEYPFLSDTMNKYQALFVSSNLTIGVGALILPNLFLQAGALFSTLFFLVSCIIAYFTSEFVVETIGICNFFSSSESQSLRIRNLSAGIEQPLRQFTQSEAKKIKKLFYMHQKFELSEIAGTLWGKQAQVIMSIAVVVFILGTTIAKCMSIGRILSQIFSEIPVLNFYSFWLVLIFAFAGTFSFKSLSHFAWVQEYAAIIKLFILYALLVGCAYESYRSGFKGLSFKNDYPLFNFNNFNSIFSLGILTFLIHHSIPAFVKPITPQKEVRWVLRMGFILAYLMIVAVCLFSIAAFGPEVIKFGEVKFIVENFKENEIILYYLSGLYIFLIVSAIPTLTITQRNTLMKLIAPDKIPLISSEITIHTFAFTSVILIIIALVCFLASNIQSVFNFIGVIGVLLLFVFPSTFVISARRQLFKKYAIDFKLNRYCTSISTTILPYFFSILGLGVFVASSYNLSS